jgi:hypothetical protein
MLDTGRGTGVTVRSLCNPLISRQLGDRTPVARLVELP